MPGQFDAVSLVHVLEHIEAPLDLLRKVLGKLRPGGLLFIQLPYYVENPFELFVADHASHFDRHTVRFLLDQAGFRVDTISTNWVSKEISIVARRLPPGRHPEDALPPSALPAMLDWLRSVIEHARTIASTSRNFGIFGTSIAGTWLFAEIGPWVRYFVDEDSNRTGRPYLGLPVLHPSEVPEDGDVYVALAPVISKEVVRRLRSSGARYHEVAALRAPGTADSPFQPAL